MCKPENGCDFRRCEALCCYDGVYLSDTEIARLWRVIARHPALFPDASPEAFITEGCWQGACSRKTAVVEHAYQHPIPAHFNRTRCILADFNGACRLEAAAILEGKHRWAFKPDACWRFPLRLGVENGCQVLQGPPSVDTDPDAGPGYPGYASCLPCAGVADWRQAFAEEIAFWQCCTSQVHTGWDSARWRTRISIRPYPSGK